MFSGAGVSVSVASGRVSFVLGLQGPCSSTDTACSSSLVAAHSGAHAIEDNDSDHALALAVSLKLTPHVTLGVAAGGMLSVDGRCKTLDSRANGYSRSEAVCALVLKVSGMHGIAMIIMI